MAGADRPATAAGTLGALSLRLLGPFELVAGGPPGGAAATLEIGSVKQRAVLAVLALHANQVVSRDALLDRLWPDEPPTSATLTLRSLVSRLRRVLDAGDGTVQLATQGPGWCLRCDADRIDAARFEALVADARARLARGEAPAAAVGFRDALTLWRSEALIDLVDAGYLAAEAAHLDAARLDAVEDLAEAELASGWAADALARLELHVAAHPLRERARGQLMVALYQLGRQAEALQAYQRLRADLREQLGIDPTPAVSELEARILRHDPALRAPPPAPVPGGPRAMAPDRIHPTPRPTVPPGVGATVGERTPFIGRAAERTTLSRLLGEAWAGRGSLVLIGGEPGIGKTRLAEEAAAEAAGLGMAVHAGHSYEMAGASPYVAFVEILESALAAAPTPEEFVAEVLADAAPEVARLLPHLRRRFPDLPAPLELPPTQERQYLFRCLLDVLGRLCADRPTLLLLDDLHWADEPTLLFVEHLAPRLGRLSLAVIATYRDAEVGRPLAHTFEALHRRRLAHRLKLGALSATEAGELVRVLAGREAPTALVQGLYVATEGNVFFLEEVLRDLMEQDRLFDADGEFRADADVAALGVPDGVRLVTARRLERLSADAQRLLTAAAVTGRVFSFGLLRGLGDLDPDTVLDVVDEAERAALIIPGTDDDEFLFAHELVRQTLTAGLSGPRRRRAHLRAAEAMITARAGDLDGHAAEIAHHLEQAADAADPKVLLAFRQRAGERALATSAFEEAFTHLERAAALAEIAGPAQRGELFFALGKAHRSLGRQDAAIGAWERARREYQAVGDLAAVGRISVEMGTCLAYWGRVTEAGHSARQGLSAIGAAKSPERARLLSVLGFVLAVAGDPDGGDRCYAEALEVAEAVGDRTVAGYVHTDRTVACHSLMRAAEGADVGLRATEALRASGELWGLASALWPCAWNLMCLGKFAESAELFEEFCTLGRRLGHYALPFERRAGGPREFYQSGDLDALVDSIGREIELFNEFLGGAWIGWSYSWMGMAEFLRGDWDRAGEWFRRGMDTVVRGGYEGWCFGSWFAYLAYCGRRAEALAVFDEHRVALGEPARPTTSGTWGLLFAFTEGLFVLGERELPAAWYPLIVEAERVNGVLIQPYAPGALVERLAGIAATAGGDYQRAENHFRRALEQAAELPHRFEQYETRRFYAGLLAERASPGDAELARRLLREAAEGFTLLRMPRHAEMAAAAQRD